MPAGSLILISSLQNYYIIYSGQLKVSEVSIITKNPTVCRALKKSIVILFHIPFSFPPRLCFSFPKFCFNFPRFRFLFLFQSNFIMRLIHFIESYVRLP